MSFKSLILPALFALGKAADDVQYETRTATITQCFTRDGLAPAPVVTGAMATVHKPGITGGAIIVEVDAPNCESCGCPTCVQTVAYTTSFQCFCDTGLCDQEYVITERYKGMEAKPTMDSQSIPFGFTCDVQTCTTCGPEPVTATITHPVTNRPYDNNVAHPTAMPPAGKPSKGDNHDNGSDYDSEPLEDGDGSKPDSDYKSDSNDKPENKPGYPDEPAPAKKPEGEPMPAPMPKPNENDGFHSAVKPTSTADVDNPYPDAGGEHPVVVSGAAGRALGVVGAGVAAFALLFSL
ncbi:uncharacterized protein FIESC28_02584 [Fusarium coffeatum]|uniref:Uncharacterized protein n=1 Tax=Fusarium coffeatum TaxID=231269 RepID=A0A366S5N6_9HYPO|nr:uncharacterized protein FIESC28_02584 [Fusarium coffeatum]RBR24651.1 hypothetical protein FIESC28_02584 [Fusarium coffeatum]